MNKQRSSQQNKALHMWFEQLADELNGTGFEQKITIGTIDCPWNKDSVKMMYKKIALAQFNKMHTSELTTNELQKVNETLNRAVSEAGISTPFPSIQFIINQ